MKGPVFSLVFAIAIANCWADTYTCQNCANSLSAITNIITSIQEVLDPILCVLPFGLGLIINALLSLVVVIFNILGNAVTGGAATLLGGLGHLFNTILGGFGK